MLDYFHLRQEFLYRLKLYNSISSNDILASKASIDEIICLPTFTAPPVEQYDTSSLLINLFIAAIVSPPPASEKASDPAIVLAN